MTSFFAQGYELYSVNGYSQVFFAEGPEMCYFMHTMGGSGSCGRRPRTARMQKKTEGELMIKTVIFDFGGVLAEEGFREGLLAIARKYGLDPEAFFVDVDSLIENTGYLTGTADETSFWNAVRAATGIDGDDGALRREILSRFI